MASLDDALAEGQGIERPINCPNPEHDDANASASVNVVKGVWYCYACAARGNVDAKKKVAPSVELLEQMLAPERSPRIYPEAWLELFRNDDGYWHTRFSAEVIVAEGLGMDPFTGDATFPVRTPAGRLAGVGRRAVATTDGPRYLYPKAWSAASSFFGWPRPATPVIALVEGAADKVSLTEVGVPALACYGAGMHLPQRGLLLRLAPKLVLLGFDSDAAGRTASERTTDLLLADPGFAGAVRTLDWGSYGDPAATPVQQRLDRVLESVSAVGYGLIKSFIKVAEANRAQLKIDYERRRTA